MVDKLNLVDSDTISDATVTSHMLLYIYGKYHI